MSQAEKLMHELTQNCGIDFNNTRRKLAVEIIDKHLNVVPLQVGDTVVIESNDDGTGTITAAMGNASAAKKSKKKAKENPDASGQ